MPAYRPDAASLAAVLREKLFTTPNPKFCDRVLTTTDGKTLPVCRPLLAARNAYFENLLYPSDGSFPDVKKEPQISEETNVNYVYVPTNLVMIRHIVEFVYTADCEFIRNLRWTSSRNKRSPANFKNRILELVRLMSISRYMQVTELELWSRKTLKHVTRKHPYLVCSTLKELECLPPPTQVHYLPLLRLFIKRLSNDPENTLHFPKAEVLPKLEDEGGDFKQPEWGVTELPERMISEVMRAGILSPEVLFRALYFWATGGRPIRRNPGEVVLMREEETRRWTVAKQLLSHVNLEKLPGKFLVSFVGPSGLVPDTELVKLLHNELSGFFQSSDGKPYEKADHALPKKRHQNILKRRDDEINVEGATAIDKDEVVDLEIIEDPITAFAFRKKRLNNVLELSPIDGDERSPKRARRKSLTTETLNGTNSSKKRDNSISVPLFRNTNAPKNAQKRKKKTPKKKRYCSSFSEGTPINGTNTPE